MNTREETNRRTVLSASLLAGVILLITAGVCFAASSTDKPAAATQPSEKQLVDAGAVIQRLLNPPISPQEKQRIERLLGDLGSNRWKVRVKATEELSRLGPETIPLIRPASNSKSPEVRLRARSILKTILSNSKGVEIEPNRAIDTLAAGGDKRLPPMLIQLLGHTDTRIRYVAEYGLRRVTGENFGYSAYADPAKRAQTADKWRKWWKENRDDFAFRKDKTPRGPFGILICDRFQRKFTVVTPAWKVVRSRNILRPFYSAAGLANGNVIVGYSSGPKNVEEYDRNFKPVWSNEGIGLGTGSISDVRRLPNGNTLIAYMNDQHVSEITPSGKVVWQKKDLKKPMSAERLPNGNTLISECGGNRVIEINPTGEIVWEKTGLNRPNDATMLPNGNVLIADFKNFRVIEVDRAGKIVWQAKCRYRPSSACRLPDGTTAINGDADAVLVDRSGKRIRRHRSGHGKIRLVPAAMLKPKQTATSTQPSGKTKK